MRKREGEKERIDHSLILMLSTIRLYMNLFIERYSDLGKRRDSMYKLILQLNNSITKRTFIYNIHNT